MGEPRSPTFLGSNHLKNLSHNEGKTVYLKKYRKGGLDDVSSSNLLGSDHLNNVTYHA